MALIDKQDLLKKLKLYVDRVLLLPDFSPYVIIWITD